MSLDTFIGLAFLVPIILAAIAGWALADKAGPWIVALPIPLLVLLFFVPYGIYLMKYGDGTDMGQASGYLGVLFGSIVAALSFVVGLGAAYLKRGRLRRR